MGQKEQINLEHVVSFEDGLRPQVHVYGIDSKTGECYGAHAYIGIFVGAGNFPKAPDKAEKEEEATAIIQRASQIQTSTLVCGFKEKIKLPKIQDYEQQLYERLRNARVNCIKIQNPEHIETAIDEYERLYIKQFGELNKRCMNLFKGFLWEHPSYDF